MKTTFLLLAFILLSAVSVQSQITPLTFEDTGYFRSYTTKLYRTYEDLAMNQTQTLKDRTSKEVSITNMALYRGIDQCFSATRLKAMADANVTIGIGIYYDQTGKIYAGRLAFLEREVVLTETEATCIFSQVFSQNLQVTFLNGPYNFYYGSIFSYKPKRAFTNPKVDPDPSNPTGDPDYK